MGAPSLKHVASVETENHGRLGSVEEDGEDTRSAPEATGDFTTRSNHSPHVHLE